ncbi:MAG: aldehyde dehydrogenase family protein [Rubricoccaceae bacterium]
MSASYENLDRLYLAGAWHRRAETAPVRNPYTGETLLEVSLASRDDVDEAFRAAEAAQQDWMAQPPQARAGVLAAAAALMEQREDEIIGWLVRESGSTRTKAALEVKSAIGITREAASFPLRMEGLLLPSVTPGKENRVYREPLGTVGVISPWNFPFHLALRSVAPALGAGNGVVVKPALETPVSGGTLIAALFEEAGLPPGLLAVVNGPGADVGDAVVRHPAPRAISFTGSTEVGRQIAETAGKSLKYVELELGGNNALVVLPDADLERAAQAAAFGKFLHAGQICIAVNRILVHEDVHDAFVARFVGVVRGLKVGNPDDPETLVGPLINQDQFDSVQEILRQTLAAGAEIAYEGETEGLVMGPVVLTGVRQDMPAAEREIFGPVAPVLRFASEDEAVEIANATPYGLSGAVFAGDLMRGQALARRIRSGMVHVNDMSVNDEPHVAFGGLGASGLGRFGGQWALEAFTTVRWVSVQHEARAYPLHGLSG